MNESMASLKFTETGTIKDNLYQGQYERTEELNSRIYNRFFPDAELKPNYDPRPISTKYALFPMLDCRKTIEEPSSSYLDFYPEVIFNPGNARGPISGYFNNIEVESELRNQDSYLTRNDLGEKYIPSLNSDMYIVNVSSKDNREQPFPNLFKTDKIEGSLQINSLPKNIGKDFFNNHTRTQLRII